MADDVKTLLLQVDASVELMRRELSGGINSLDGFERQADRMATQVEGHFDKVNMAANIAKGTILGLLASFSYQALEEVGRAILRFADELDAAATQANVNVERYQTLREGLRKLEISTEQTDNVLKRLSETLGAVQGGTAADGVVKALDRMGITSRILNGEIASTDELLDAVAAASSRYATEALYTADVVDIVGRKLGVDLAAALRDGGAALKEQEQAFRDAGGVIEADYIARLADANEALDAFTTLQKSRVTIWAAEMIERVGQVGRALSDMNKWRLLSPLTTLPYVANRIAAEDSWQDDFGLRGMAARERADRDMINALPVGSDARRMAEQKYQDTYLKSFDAKESRQTFNPAGKDKPGKGRTKAARAGKEDPWITFEATAITQEVEQIARDAQKALADQLDVSKWIDDAEADDFQSQIEAIAKAATKPFDDAQAGAEKIKALLLQGVVYGGNIGKALVNSFKAAAAEAAISGIFDLFKVGSGGGGWLGTAANAALRLFGGGKASGGPVDPSRYYVVGENGPELFVPDAAGTIIPNGGGGGGGGRLVFDLRGAVMTADLLAQMQAMAAQGAITAIGIGRSDMAAARRPRLPRGMGA